jgi:hypothetical protein
MVSRYRGKPFPIAKTGVEHVITQWMSGVSPYVVSEGLN